MEILHLHSICRKGISFSNIKFSYNLQQKRLFCKDVLNINILNTALFSALGIRISKNYAFILERFEYILCIKILCKY